MVLNTATVSLAVTPTVVSTLFSHYLNRKPLRQRPTAHLSYDEGLHLIRSFLVYASHHTVEEVQAFTSQWVPHPQWVRVEEVTVPDEQLLRAAAYLEEQLGPDGIRKVGGQKWWQWRKPRSPLRAEWIEMRSDYSERKKTASLPNRVMLYVHGGAYFFGSVDEHRYQMQRHARKLRARVFAPRYRLAPQFPFPCGLQDCLAAYLHLLTLQDPSTILLAGDSAGGGMVISLLVVLRDRGIPLPAGAVLISPWVDLTHSFPSVGEDSPLDYIPPYGFHQKPSMSWPPPTEDDLLEMDQLSSKAAEQLSGQGDPTQNAAFQVNRLTCMADGDEIQVKEQIQMYATNELLAHPLVSPIMQPTLGGLPPLLIMVGGGEMLRDEQIYLAHKCANPAKYAPDAASLDERGQAAIAKYKPTDVQLQVWEDLCHVAPTLSFTRPAKHMFRSIAQFGAWALARAQKIGIEIVDDDQISVISSSDSESESAEGSSGQSNGKSSGKNGGKSGVKSGVKSGGKSGRESKPSMEWTQVGKAGDPLPPFKGHMIRQSVTRHGDVFPLEPASQLPGCNMAVEFIGIPKKGPLGKWLQARQHWSSRYAGDAVKVHKRRLRDAAVGFELFGPGEYPPPSALAGRRKIGADMADKKTTKRSYGLALWSMWGSKHDETTVARQLEADETPETTTASAADGQGSRSFGDIQRQEKAAATGDITRSRSRRRVVRDERQAEQQGGNGFANEDTPLAELLAIRNAQSGGRDCDKNLLTPPAAAENRGAVEDGTHTSECDPATGATGKRPMLGGIALPFTLDKEADTASMVTLHSDEPLASPLGSAGFTLSVSHGAASPLATEFETDERAENTAARPHLETFVTASEIPRATANQTA